MRTSPGIRGAAGPCIQHRRPERYRQVDGVPIRRFSASRAGSRGEAAQSPTPASSSGPGRAAGAIAAPRTIAGANWSRSRLAEVKSSALPERERPLSGRFSGSRRPKPARPRPGREHRTKTGCFPRRLPQARRTAGERDCRTRPSPGKSSAPRSRLATEGRCSPQNTYKV
jgi:hypothetical protein